MRTRCRRMVGKKPFFHTRTSSHALHICGSLAQFVAEAQSEEIAPVETSWGNRAQERREKATRTHVKKKYQVDETDCVFYSSHQV